MTQDKLDQLLHCIKKESIDFNTIDSKTDFLIYKTPHYYMSSKIPLMTAMFLLIMVSTLGSIISYNEYQQKIALKLLEQDRKNILNSSYIYSTLISSYKDPAEK